MDALITNIRSTYFELMGHVQMHLKMLLDVPMDLICYGSLRYNHGAADTTLL